MSSEHERIMVDIFGFCGGKLVTSNYSFITQTSAGYLGEREGRFPDSCPLVSGGKSQVNNKSQYKVGRLHAQ